MIGAAAALPPWLRGVPGDWRQMEHGASSRRKRVRVETSLAASVLLAALGG